LAPLADEWPRSRDTIASEQEGPALGAHVVDRVLERGVARLRIVAIDHRGLHAERLAAVGDLVVAVLPAYGVEIP